MFFFLTGHMSNYKVTILVGQNKNVVGHPILQYRLLFCSPTRIFRNDKLGDKIASSLGPAAEFNKKMLDFF